MDRIEAGKIVGRLSGVDRVSADKVSFALGRYKVGLAHKLALFGLDRAESDKVGLYMSVIVQAPDRCFAHYSVLAKSHSLAEKTLALYIGRDSLLVGWSQRGPVAQNLWVDSSAEDSFEAGKPVPWVGPFEDSLVLAVFAVGRAEKLAGFPKLVFFSYWQRVTAHWQPSSCRAQKRAPRQLYKIVSM